jgi:general secretion pathway protein D
MAAAVGVTPLKLPAQDAASSTTATTEPSAAPAPVLALEQPTKALIKVNFQDANVDAVLDYLSKEAGLVIVKIAKPTSRVTILSEKEMSPDEAISLLNSFLKADGVTAIRTGRILRILSIDKMKKTDIPVYTGDDPAKVPQTDDLITQVIPLKSVDAVKLKTDLAPLVSTDADISANGASNSIVITDTGSNVHRVVEIISSLDVQQSSENNIIVKQLKYADATAAAKLIMDIFSPTGTSGAQTPGQGGNPFFRFGGFPGGGFGGGGGGFGGFGGGGGGGNRPAGGGGGAPAGGAAAANSGSTEGATGHVQASADTRTNTVVVSGPSDTIKVIDSVLSKLDANPIGEENFFIYQVKNGVAVDMANTLNGLFGGTSSGSTSSTANRSQYNSSTGNRVSGSSGFGGGGGLGGGGGGGLGGSGGLGGGSSQGGANANRSIATNGAAAGTQNRGATGIATGANGTQAGGISDLIGQVLIVPDQDTNSLLVATATKYEQQVRDVINQLDRPVPQVLIKVLIAEVTHDNTLNLGTDFSVLDVGGPTQKLSSTLGAAAAAASAAQPGGLVFSLMESNVTATLQTLAQENKLDVLSRPYILTSDNQEADITVGDEVPFITDSYVDVNGGTHNTVQYQDIGIILTVTPHVNPEGMVTMLLSPQISSLTGQTVTIQAGVNVPVFEIRSADSYLTCKDGQTIVIGGLMQDQNTTSISKIPLLGDIPLIGPVLFSYNNISKTKTELLIFMTPHVAAVPDRLKSMSEDEMKGLKLTPNAVEPGVFQDYMRGMQRGGATNQPSLYVPPPTTRQDNTLQPDLPGDKNGGH